MTQAREARALGEFDSRQVPPCGECSDPCLYLIGEAPGAQEVAEGRPFVGPAGQWLRDMLLEAEIDLSHIRLANAVPLRPIHRSAHGRIRNRTPARHEIRELSHAVLRDIRHVRPASIVALGASACILFGVEGSVSRNRGTVYEFENIPVWVTYHPSYVRRFSKRQPSLYQQVVDDLRRCWEQVLEDTSY